MENKENKKNETEHKVETSYNIEIQKVEKPNSFECGRASLRHKVYYNEIEELRKRLLDLEALGLIDLEECNIDLSKLKVKPEGDNPDIR